MEIIPFTHDFPYANIHKLISSDLLHQAIKGMFKDHLVDCVGVYLAITHEKAEAEQVMDKIDWRYVLGMFPYSQYLFFYLSKFIF